MSTVRRSIVINPVEPSPLSFRVGTAVDTNLNITLYDQHDPPQPISVDVNAQLQMISRSNDGITTTYAAPGTDIANGKIAAFIPASDMRDPNGYQVYLYGTLAGDGQMLARGVALLDYFQPATPAPIDVIDTIPMTLNRALSDPTVYTVQLWQDTGKTIPTDLTSATVTATITASQGGSLLVPFAVAITLPNIAQLSLTEAQIVALPDSCWWQLTIANASGVTTLCQGPVTVSGVPLLPLSYILQATAGVASATTDILITSTFTPPANSLLVVVASSLVPLGRSVPAAISGGGLTWTKQKEQVVTNAANPWQANVEIWTAPVATGASMAVTIDFKQTNPGDSGGYYQVRVISFTGFDSVSPVAQVFGDGGTAGRTGAYTATWPTVPNVHNWIITASADNDTSTSPSNIAPGADFTQIDAVVDSFFQTLSQYRTGSASTTVSMNNFTTVGAFAWSIAGIEIRAQQQ